MTSGAAFGSAFGIGASGGFPQIRPDAVAVDPAGDRFITGSFRGTVSFDPYSTASTFTTANTQDAFVARYTPTGSLAWVKVFSGRASDRAGGGTSYATSQGSALAVDAAGNVFVAGSFSGTVGLPGTSSPASLSSPSGTSAFAAKLDGSGNLAWAVASGGSSNDVDEAYALALDGAGGVNIAGSFSGTATFGPFALTAGGSSDAFAAHLGGNGQFLWAVATRGSGVSTARAGGIAVDPSGNLDLVGSFSGTVGFGPGGGMANLTSAGLVDAAVWRLGPGGNLLWARRFGSTDFDTADSVAVDGSGNLYATGAFSGTVDFGSGARPDTLTAGPIFDAFALKLGPAGNEVWARGYVGPGGWSKGQSIALDRSGGVHIAGTFNGVVDFDPGPGAANLTSGGYTDAFVAGLDGLGNRAYALQAGQRNANTALGLAVSPAGPAAITGSYTGPITFGATTLPAIGPSSLFVASLLLPDPPPAPGSPVLQAASDTGISSSDGITSAGSPSFDISSAEQADLVRLLRNGVPVASRIGPGAIRDPGPLVDGVYTYTATQARTSGLASPASPGTLVTILTRPPAAPGSAPSLAAVDDSGAANDGITQVRQPRLVGSAAPDSTVQVVDGSGAVLGRGTTARDGSYSIALGAPLADGTYRLGVRVVDLAGNLGASGPAFGLTIDTTPPPVPIAPTLLAADDTGAVGDGLTAVRRPRLAGSSEPFSRVEWIDGAGSVILTTTASATGSYQLQPPTALPNGTYPIRVRATDRAGNSGPIGAPINLTIRVAAADSFGDGQTDFAAYSPVNNTFYIGRPAGLGQLVKAFGYPGDVPVSGDFFGLGHADVALYHPGTSTFSGFDAVTGAYTSVQLGQPGDIPAPGDFDGDGQTDFAVYRPGTRTYLIRKSTTGAVLSMAFGIAGDVPVPADYFGSGHSAVAVYRPATSTFVAFDLVTAAFARDQWGTPGDLPVPADYEGLGLADLATYTPGTSTFNVRLAVSHTPYVRRFGVAGDVPVPGDYFGDGRADIAVFRPATSTFLAAEITGDKFQVVPYGPAGILRPVLGPITGWLSPGSISPRVVRSPGAAPASGGPRSAVEPGEVPAETGDAVPPTAAPARKKVAGPAIIPPGRGLAGGG